MDNIDNLNDNQRIAVSSEELTAHEANVRDTERQLRNASRAKSKPGTRYDLIFKEIAGMVGDVKRGWDKERIHIGLKNAKDGLDAKIAESLSNGDSLGMQYDLVHNEDKLADIRAKLQNDLKDVSSADARRAMKGFDSYLKIKRDNITAASIKDQQRMKIRRSRELLNAHQIAVIDGVADTAEYQNRLRSDVESLDLGEEIEGDMWKAIDDTANRAKLQKALVENNEAGADFWLDKNKNNMSAKDYARAKEEIKQIPIRIDKEGLETFKSGNINEINLFTLSNPKSALSKSWEKVASVFLSGKDKYNKPTIASLQGIIDNIDRDKAIDKKEKKRRKALAAIAYKQATDMIKNDPQGMYEALDAGFQDLTPQQRKNLSGRFTSNVEREVIWENMKGSFLQGQFNTFINSFGDGKITGITKQGKLKEAIAYGEEQIKKGDQKAHHIVGMLKAKFYHGDSLNIDEAPIKDYIAKTPMDEVPGLEKLEKMADSEAYDQFRSFFKNAPGGDAAKNAWLLNAWVKSIRKPAEGETDKERAVSRRANFNEELANSLDEELDSGKVIGNDGKWTMFKVEGSSEDKYIDNDLLTNPNASNQVTDFVKGIDTKEILEKPIFHASMLERIGENSKLDPRRNGNKWELWYSYENEEGHTRWDVAVDLNGAKLTTTDQMIGKFGTDAFYVSHGKVSRYSKEPKKNAVRPEYFTNKVTTDGYGRLNVKSKRDADLSVLLGAKNSDHVEAGIERLFGKGVKINDLPVKGDIRRQESALTILRNRAKKELKKADSRQELIITYIAANKGWDVAEKSIGRAGIFKPDLTEALEATLKKGTPFVDRNLSSEFLNIIEAASALGILTTRSLKLPPRVKLSMRQDEIEEYNLKVIEAYTRGKETRDKARNQLGYDFSGSRMGIEDLSSDLAIERIR